MSETKKGPIDLDDIEEIWERTMSAKPFARALLALAGDRLHEELKYSMSHDTANTIRRILGVKHE